MEPTTATGTAPHVPLWRQRLMWIVWPAFLAAAVLEVLVFALVDPGELRWAGGTAPWPAMAVYTAGFFVFWSVALMASALTALLAMPPAEVNRPLE